MSAGTHDRAPRLSTIDPDCLSRLRHATTAIIRIVREILINLKTVIPAKAGIQCLRRKQLKREGTAPRASLRDSGMTTRIRASSEEATHTDDRCGLTGNKLLAALPSADRERFGRFLRRVELPFGKVIHEPGTVRCSVYFPIDCVFSKQFATTDGAAAEVASVGNEGLVGIPLLLGCTRTPIRTVVHVGGTAWSGDGVALRQEFVRSPALQNLVLRFTQALMIQMGQNATCYQHHSVEQQFCRWLLLTLDRTHSPRLHVTHDLIAQTLGVRRAGISEVVGKLVCRHAIRNGRGSIDVLDRARLETACCECHAVIMREYARLLP